MLNAQINPSPKYYITVDEEIDRIANAAFEVHYMFHNRYFHGLMYTSELIEVLQNKENQLLSVKEWDGY